MPSSPGYKRNYKKEYANYHSKPKQVKNRTARGAARNKLKKAGISVTGRDVAHRNGNPRDNSRSNLAVKPASKNRSYARTRNARKRNPRA